MEIELRILKLSSKVPAKNKPYDNQFLPYKITADVAKSLHQDSGPCCLQLPNFFLNIHYPILKQNKNLL